MHVSQPDDDGGKTPPDGDTGEILPTTPGSSGSWGGVSRVLLHWELPGFNPFSLGILTNICFLQGIRKKYNESMVIVEIFVFKN